MRKKMRVQMSLLLLFAAAAAAALLLLLAPQGAAAFNHFPPTVAPPLRHLNATLHHLFQCANAPSALLRAALRRRRRPRDSIS